MPNYSYNSVIYASIGANKYSVFLVNQTFVERYENVASTQTLTRTTPTPEPSASVPTVTVEAGYEQYASSPSGPSGLIFDDALIDINNDGLVLRRLQESALAGKLDKLDNEDCIRSYGKLYLSNRSNLLLVGSASSLTVNSSIIFENVPGINCAEDPVPWICPRYDCEVPCVNRLNEVEPQNWTIAVFYLDGSESLGPPLGPVAYCLSQSTEESCKLQFSFPIAMVIIFFNFFKAVIMLILVFGLREDRVQTIGDAIASFLIQPDHIVNSRCLYNTSDFKQAGLSGHPLDLIFTNKSMRFAETGGKRVWLLTYIL
jgi:hypothetical protein